MADPFERATAALPPVIGEGCTQRFDLDALGENSGTDFPGATELWASLTRAVADESESGV
ncbi:hypothetical protein IQ22_00245 [Pseudomonas duriflava]|uniref:Uncharacterized protein n=1 Tax=Pseudomonas duriflava TaxID=459528 RepID=A0A562QP59_9PSED|nr:hypothetical protein [Pseudomonas duriflava]TWI58539.1 hypothetical protein IQ22_00245 [Pseudomonas duriflava]